MSVDAPAAAEPQPPIALRRDTPFDALAAILLWVVGLAWLVPTMGILMLLHRTIGVKRVQWLERLYCRGQILLTGTRWRAVVHPAIDPERAYVFVQNHTSHLDHCAMYCATPHLKQGVELAAHFRYPVYGPFMRGRGTIPVDPGDPAALRALVRRMRAELARGHSLLVFPEGTRTLDGRLGPFREGTLRIVLGLGAPVVPVTVTGLYRVMRKGSWLIRPGHRATVHCHAPIETAGLTRAGLPSLVERVRGTMNAQLDAYWRGLE